MQVIGVQVPEIPDRAAACGTEAPSDLVADSALQFLVIEAGE